MNVIGNPTDFLIDIEPSEVWAFKNPKRGDHIRVCRMNGVYYHHGVYVSDAEVIHFAFWIGRRLTLSKQVWQDF